MEIKNVSFRRIIAAFIMICLLFSIAACSKKNDDSDNAGDGANVNQSDDNKGSDQVTGDEKNTDGQVTDETANDDGSFVTNADYSKLAVTVKGNEFFIDGGEKRLWINGTNTPWNSWNEFGMWFEEAWWDEHFRKLHENGVNATRVWINCSGDNTSIPIDENGMIGTEITQQHWDDLDRLFAIAEKYEIYIMATLLAGQYDQGNGSRWMEMMTKPEAIDSFVSNYVVPFVQRYGVTPYLWSIDLMNEPDDHILSADKTNGSTWANLQELFAKSAAAIHENSKVLVTVGMMYPGHNADRYEGNKISDAALQAAYDNVNAYLDFWSPHYYPWVGEWFYTPFYMSPEKWGLDDSKPSLIGECAALGSDNYSKTYNDTGYPTYPDPEPKTLFDNYESALQNGWQGVMPWTSNGVDNCGGFSDLVKATQPMTVEYMDLIFPFGYNDIE